MKPILLISLALALALALALGCWAQSGVKAGDPSVPDCTKHPELCAVAKGSPVTVPPEIKALESDLAQLREENAKLSKLLTAWHREAQVCWIQRVNEAALAKEKP